MNRRSDNLDSCDEPQSGSDSGQSSLEWEDVIRHAVLKSQSMGRVPGHDDNGLMLSPVEACCGDKELSMDEVRSEGLRQWNMDMDVECQYEAFNGLPVYYGGDLCDSKELEEYDTLNLARAAYTEDDNFDAPEGMDLMTYTRDLRGLKFQARTHTAPHRLGPHPHRTSLSCGGPHPPRNIIFKARTAPHI